VLELALVVERVHFVDDARGLGMHVRVADERVAETGATHAFEGRVDALRALRVVETRVVPVENGGCIDLQHL
jgi:hypothetical protein